MLVPNITDNLISGFFAVQEREWLRCALFIALATGPTLSIAGAELPAEPALEVRVALAKSQNEPCTSAPGLKDRATCRADIGCDQKERCIVRFPMIPPVSNTLCEMAEEEVTLN